VEKVTPPFSSLPHSDCTPLPGTSHWGCKKTATPATSSTPRLPKLVHPPSHSFFSLRFLPNPVPPTPGFLIPPRWLLVAHPATFFLFFPLPLSVHDVPALAHSSVLPITKSPALPSFTLETWTCPLVDSFIIFIVLGRSCIRQVKCRDRFDMRSRYLAPPLAAIPSSRPLLGHGPPGSLVSL